MLNIVKKMMLAKKVKESRECEIATVMGPIGSFFTKLFAAWFTCPDCGSGMRGVRVFYKRKIRGTYKADPSLICPYCYRIINPSEYDPCCIN